MVYNPDSTFFDEFARKNNCSNWTEFAIKFPFPTKKKLEDDREEANSILNEWIGSFNVDITDPRFTTWLRRKELEVILRMHDKDINRKQGERGIYTPHDHLYERERQKCKTIGVILGYRVVGGVG